MPGCGSGVPVSSCSLLIHGEDRRPQAEIPLILLSRFPGPALSAANHPRQTLLPSGPRARCGNCDDGPRCAPRAEISRSPLTKQSIGQLIRMDALGLDFADLIMIARTAGIGATSSLAGISKPISTGRRAFSPDAASATAGHGIVLAAADDLGLVDCLRTPVTSGGELSLALENLSSNPFWSSSSGLAGPTTAGEEEFAPDMGPTGGFGDPVAPANNSLNPAHGSGLRPARGQAPPSAWMTAVNSFRWARGCSPPAFTRAGFCGLASNGTAPPSAAPGERPFITNIDPQPPGLGFAGARHRHRRVVDMQGVGGVDIGDERVDQRLEGRRRRPDPA